LTGPTAHDGTSPEMLAAAARWRRGEERLYLAALGGTDAYQSSLNLVARTLDHLRSRGTGFVHLLEAGARGADLVAEALGHATAGSAPVDLAVVADAALALRYREVMAEATAQRRLERLEAARERGDRWAVLETSGDPAGDPLQPYRRLAGDVRTGRAVLVTTTPSDDFTHCLHAVEALSVDLQTGALAELEDAALGAEVVAATVHLSAAAREQRATALQAKLTNL
jgi:hypothetical protein